MGSLSYVIPHGSIVSTTVNSGFNTFIVFMNGSGDGIEITLTRYDDDAKLCVEVAISEGRAILQRDLVRLKVIQGG